MFRAAASLGRLCGNGSLFPVSQLPTVLTGASRASSHHGTQADAIDRGRQIVHNAGGGELRIHGVDGKIRDSDTIAPGNDPNPPKDRK